MFCFCILDGIYFNWRIFSKIIIASKLFTKYTYKMSQNYRYGPDVLRTPDGYAIVYVDGACPWVFLIVFTVGKWNVWRAILKRQNRAFNGLFYINNKSFLSGNGQYGAKVCGYSLWLPLKFLLTLKAGYGVFWADDHHLSLIFTWIFCFIWIKK